LIDERASTKAHSPRTNHTQLMNKIVNEGLRPDMDGMPTALQQLASECFSIDPNLRPSFSEIVVRIGRVEAFEVGVSVSPASWSDRRRKAIDAGSASSSSASRSASALAAMLPAAGSNTRGGDGTNSMSAPNRHASGSSRSSTSGSTRSTQFSLDDTAFATSAALVAQIASGAGGGSRGSSGGGGALLSAMAAAAAPFNGSVQSDDLVASLDTDTLRLDDDDEDAILLDHDDSGTDGNSVRALRLGDDESSDSTIVTSDSADDGRYH